MSSLIAFVSHAVAVFARVCLSDGWVARERESVCVCVCESEREGGSRGARHRKRESEKKETGIYSESSLFRFFSAFRPSLGGDRL
jgi:hypothetical protein